VGARLERRLDVIGMAGQFAEYLVRRDVVEFPFARILAWN
jgi:hypothetical protein